MERNEFTKLEEKAYREHYADGHVEFISGVGLVLLFLSSAIHISNTAVGLIFLLVVVALLLWKDLVSSKFVGYVKFSPAIVEQTRKRYALVTIGYLIALALVVTPIIVFHEGLATRSGLGNILDDIIFIAATTFLFIAFAVARRAPRHYVVAFVNLVAWSVVPLFNTRHYIPFVADGVVLALFGGVMLWNFFRTHPRLEKVLTEPRRPEVEAEFQQKLEHERKLLKSFRSDGTVEFYFGLMYLSTALEFGKISPLVNIVEGIGFVLILVWATVIVKSRMGKKYYRVPWNFITSRVSIRMILAIVLIGAVIVSMTGLYSSNLFSYLKLNPDLLRIVPLASYFLIVNFLFSKATGAPFNAPLLATAAIFVVLHFCSVPIFWNGIILAALTFPLAVYRAVRFFKLPPPQPLEAI